MATKESKYAFFILTLSVIPLSGLGLFSNYYFQKKSINQNSSNTLTKYKKELNAYLDNEVNMISSILELVKEKDEYTEPFNQDNKKQLFQLTKPLFDKLNKNNDITHFYFLKPDGKVLLRVHDLNRHGDTVKRYTFLQAKRYHSPYHGIEFGIKKNYTLRVVHPWIKNNKLIGFIEIGKEIDKISQTLSSKLNIEMYYGVDASIFENSPLFVQKKLSQKKFINDTYLIYQTNVIPNNISNLLDHHNHHEWIWIDNQAYISHIDVLKDVSNRDLGTILYLVNVTDEYDAFLDSFINFTAIMGFSSLFLLIIGFLLIQASQKQINHTLDQLENAKKHTDIINAEQRNLLSLFDTGDSVLFKWNNDRHWTIEYVSKSVTKLLGYPIDDFLTSKIFKFFLLNWKSEAPNINISKLFSVIFFLKIL
ncbi:MAG: hypothetical protein OQJ77_06115 [Thiovulaceae bacterium]|nr:hypothetical protein [Sulfurimonadaceae bacterium]